MSNLLKDTYDNFEAIKGRRLLYTLLAIFVVFIIIGISIGYLMSPKLSEDENNSPTEYLPNNDNNSGRIEIEGRITYVNPEMYPDDKISYSLTDPSGRDIYLLKANDQKLTIAEGLTAKVVGKLSKLSDGKTEVLIVEEVIIKSAAD